jgi:hypothetical protein
MRNSRRSNIGDATRVSIQVKTPSSAAPPISPASTQGLVQPITWPP